MLEIWLSILDCLVSTSVPPSASTDHFYVCIWGTWQLMPVSLASPQRDAVCKELQDSGRHPWLLMLSCGQKKGFCSQDLCPVCVPSVWISQPVAEFHNLFSEPVQEHFLNISLVLFNFHFLQFFQANSLPVGLPMRPDRKGCTLNAAPIIGAGSLWALQRLLCGLCDLLCISRFLSEV